MAKASAAQLRKIYHTARQLDIDNDELHGIVESMTGCGSLRELSIHHAVRVIDRLSAMTGTHKDVPNRASQGQQSKILAMAYEMGWGEQPERLRGFLEKRAGVSDVRFLDIQAARRIIEAMKAMRAGGRAERPRPREEAVSERLDE